MKAYKVFHAKSFATRDEMFRSNHNLSTNNPTFYQYMLSRRRFAPEMIDVRWFVDYFSTWPKSKLTKTMLCQILPFDTFRVSVRCVCGANKRKNVLCASSWLRHTVRKVYMSRTHNFSFILLSSAGLVTGFEYRVVMFHVHSCSILKLIWLYLYAG